MNSSNKDIVVENDIISAMEELDCLVGELKEFLGEKQPQRSPSKDSFARTHILTTVTEEKISDGQIEHKIKYVSQIEATLQVIEMWSDTSIPDFDNENIGQFHKFTTQFSSQNVFF